MMPSRLKQKLYDGMKEVLSDDKGLGTPQNFIDIYRNNYLYGTPIREFRQQLEDASRLKSSWRLTTCVLGSSSVRWETATSPSSPIPIAPPYQLSARREFLKEALDTILPYRRPKAVSLHLSRSSSTSSSPQEITRGEKKIPSLDATEWTLSNGMRSFIRIWPRSSRAESLFLASAKGGQSIVKPADLLLLSYAEPHHGLRSL